MDINKKFETYNAWEAWNGALPPQSPVEVTGSLERKIDGEILWRALQQISDTGKDVNLMKYGKNMPQGQFNSGLACKDYSSAGFVLPKTVMRSTCSLFASIFTVAPLVTSPFISVSSERVKL